MRKLKKTLSLILALALALSLIGCSAVQSAIDSATGKDPSVAGNKPAGDHSGDKAPAQGGQQGAASQEDNVTWSLVNGVLTISGSGAMYNMPEYKGRNRWPWATNHEEITSVVIENGITIIGQNAFAYCPNLTSVTMPDTITEIWSNVFLHCDCLTSVTIPASVTTIGERAFAGCAGLTSITIPDSVTAIGAEAFSYCDGLTSVTIPDSVTWLDAGTFAHCKNLTEAIVGKSVEDPGLMFAFCECPNLVSLTIHSSTIHLVETTLLCYDEEQQKRQKENCIIYAPAGSYIEQSCKEYGYNFSPLG